MNAAYRSYQLEKNYSLADYCKLYSHFPFFFLGHCATEGNDLPTAYRRYDKLVAGGYRKAGLNVKENFFRNLQEIRNNKAEWSFGYFAYDLKNQLEKLSSQNKDYMEFEDGGFFFPAFIFLEKDQKTTLLIQEEECNKNEILALLEMIRNWENKPGVILQELCDKTEYLKAIHKIKERITRGDIYEINFCRAWLGQYETLFPESVFLDLCKLSKAPFSSLFKMEHLSVIGASPERFLLKEGNRLLSQPIKGTRKRSADKATDLELKKQLADSEKERAENVMIVDLVRNDLSKYAQKGSVKVEELFGIYTFEQVHQMISGISAELKSDKDSIKALAGAFPMGSMTGAPKISAMKIIEEYENFKRGIYSGSIGYFDGEGNFDFNVVIRSILVNTEKKKLLFAAGGAITQLSDPEEEFEETRIKAGALAAVLGHKI